jgi:hypothetical protein
VVLVPAAAVGAVGDPVNAAEPLNDAAVTVPLNFPLPTTSSFSIGLGWFIPKFPFA